MAKKQLNTSGVDMSVFQKKGLNTEGVDMSVFDVKKKEFGDEVSEPSEEPFSLDTSVDLSQYQKPTTEKRVPNEKELFLSAFSDDEKEIVSKAFDATNQYFRGMGGMTPTQKMRELDSRLKAVQSKYQPEDIASFSEEELAQLEKDYTDIVAANASELGLRINEDGTIAPYEEELQLFKQKLEDNIRLAEKASEKEAGFFENLYLKLGAGYESASANVLDLVGTITGLNYFESYKSLSEGNQYTAEQLSSLANKYDNTIENYLVNGEIGKAAGAAVSGAVESLPGMLPIFINPQYGLYVMSGMSGIDKYREIEESSIPEWEKYYNAFITGASEYAGEKLVTIPILARSKKALLSLGEKRGKQAIENAVKKTVENNASKLGRMPEWVSEGLSEVATGISTDIVDKVTVNPDIEIGGQAVDNFAVGAVMGKIFALPQDVSVARNRLAARDFAKKVIDKLPADMSIESKISLGWKIAERDALQQAEDKLDEGFKGKYQERIDVLNAEIDAAAVDYLGVLAEPVTETEVPTVGKAEPVGEMQQKLDYLIERGVEVPDGSKESDVDKLYRQERVKAIKEGNAELDTRIAEAQTRLGLEITPDVEISDDTELTLEQLDNGEPVTNEFLKKASDELYKKYNELEAMKQSDSRVYTTEQIESMQEFLGEEITKLEDYAKEQAETGKFVGETETGEVAERGTEEVVETDQPQIGEEDFVTDNAVMEGVYGNEVEIEGDTFTLPETGFLISDVFLREGVEKGKGFGQDLYRKALDRFGILYSTYPISEDAIRVQNRLEEKGELTIDFIEIDGVEFRVLRKIDNAKPRVEQENIVKPKIKEDGKEMQEREGAQQGVQKPEDEVTERSEETAEAGKEADEEAVVEQEVGQDVQEEAEPQNVKVEAESGFVKQKPTKGKKEAFSIRVSDKDGNPTLKEVRGNRISFPGYEDLDVFVHKEGEQWIVSEGRTGLRLATSYKSADEAMEAAFNPLLWQQSFNKRYDSIYKQINDQIDRLGIEAEKYEDKGVVRLTDQDKIDVLNRAKKNLEQEIKENETGMIRYGTDMQRRTLQNINARIEEIQQQLTTAPQKPSDSVSPEKGVTTPQKEKVADRGITEVDTINRDYKKLKEKLGERKTKKYFEQVDRLFDPIKNEIVEYRPSGVVIKNGDKYEFHALMDMDLKNWRVSGNKPIDVTEQFVREEKVAETAPTQAETAKLEQARAILERDTKKAENKERLARIFDNAARLTGARKDIVGDERKQIRKQLIDDVIEYVKTEFELAGQALVDRVKSFVKENNIPVDDLQDNEITKSKSYAEEIGKKVKEPVQEKRTEQKEVRQVRVRDDEKDGVETKPPEKGVKERSFGKTLATAGGFFEKLQHDSPMFYVVRRSQQAIEAAAAWLQERTEGQAYQELKKRHYTSISADRQDRREVFLAYLNEQLNMAVADNDLLRAEEVHEMLKTLRVITSEEYTRAGQVVQTAAHWRSISQDAVRWSVQHEIDRRNEKEVPYTNVTKLKESGEEVNKMSKGAGKNVTEDERVQQVINEVVNKQKGRIRQTNREKAKVVAQKIRSFKSSNWGITLAAEPISAVGIGVLDGALELTAKTVELSGNVADAIQRGVKQIKQSEWYNGLKEAQQRKIERVFAMNVRKGLGVDKFSKTEINNYLKQEVRDLGKKLNDVIKEHWETKNELGVMLSERIIADLGLSEADAKLIEDTVQEIINEKINENINEFVDPELIPKKEESRKTFINKMGKLVMRGDLDTKLFRDKFTETFGLTPDLTAQQATDIINLHKAVVETADMGIYGDVVAYRFAKEVDKLIPQTKTERLLSGMVALDYANMLFGYTTWFVNIMSAAANIAIRPISETLDFVKWYNSIQTAREWKSFPVFLANNPMVDGFRAWIDFAKGMTRISPHSVMDTLLSGGLREMNKYISQVESTAKLRVPELEREVYGKNRFATKLKYKGKTLVDFKYNPFNFMKFSGRFLVAQDVGMFSAFESVELAAKLRKKLLKEGYSEKEITDHINRQVTGASLTEEQKDSVDKQLKKEEEQIAKLGIKTDIFRRNRRRMEIIREQFLELPEEDLLDAERAAKGQIYTDTRGGVVNSIMSVIGNLSNKNIYTKLLIMPYFPFVKIFANIGDFVLDTVPAYGWLRYRGYSPSTMWAQYLANKEAGMQQPKAVTNAVFGKRRPMKELPFLTAQLGDKGTQARERQRQRAMFGNFVMLPAISVIAGLWAFGKDDDDEPWFDVSGARFDVKDQAQRESVPDRMPPWTIKMGEWRFRYQNKPGLMFPMAMLGFYRDMQRADYSDEEIRDRLKLMGQAFMGAFSAMTDLQIAGGFKDLTESLDKLITTAKAYNEDPTAEDIKTRRYLENFGKYLTRKTITPFTTWLPTKNNLVQQTIQFISEERKESRSIRAILFYNAGIHHWTNRDALDIFGKTTYSKPGFTQILYKPVLEKRDPQRWKAFEKLFEADAVPAPYWNKMEMVIKNPTARKDGEPMYEYQLPTEDEFWTLRQKSGNRFYEDILRYQDSEAWDIEKEKFSGTLTRSRTVLQDKVARYWNDSKKQTRHYLFTWKEFEKENKDVYAKLYDNAAFPDVVTSVDIPAFDPINETYMYVDEKGQPTILDTVTLGKDEVAELNAMAFRDYIEMLDRLGMEDDFAFKMSAQNLWKQVVQLNTQPFIQKYYDNME